MADTLSARGISQRFGERVVLDDVDLEVPSGRVIGLLGPNGAGKTTLMRILFGVLPPDAGIVEWRGRPADDDDRRSWGYMPQERGLYRDMRVLDQLVWLARLHGLDQATGPAGRRTCSSASGSVTAAGTRSRTSRAAWRSGCSWRRRWSTSRTCSCSTSRSPGSTPRRWSSCPR